ncbi:major histocompatibility complex class I-related gene protein-like isoform X2 [Rana temporaria]|uniref:major histocompatibility complex class I-related gene protein-like isoform X2 n=1 Tax=Rana temporaria TaxID=8407 RepID=UPI001AACAE58|nr:major histocompatibility complex class I-related gene protein-like isoform X2 [Rana temporaria]
MALLGYVLINYLCLLIVRAERHSLRYHFTTDSTPGAGNPSYQAVGYVDDIQISRYDSKTRRVQLLLPWMETDINPRHWENQTWIAQYYEGRQQEITRDIIKHFNNTKDRNNGLVLQVRFWCQMSGDEDDNVSGYEEFAANGDHFIALDTFMSKYVSLKPDANKMTDAWNSRKSSAEKQKWYMEQECKTWFKVYLDYMKESLKPVRPEVKVWDHHQSEEKTRLHCLAYGFHPPDVDVKWVRNGKDHIPSYEMTPILPHPDGTYQIRVSVEVPTMEGYNYSCHVHHSSLDYVLIVTLTEQDMQESKTGKQSSGLTALYIVIIVLILLVICGLVIIVKKFYSRRGQAVKTEEEGMEESDS